MYPVALFITVPLKVPFSMVLQFSTRPVLWKVPPEIVPTLLVTVPLKVPSVIFPLSLFVTVALKVPSEIVPL